MKVHTQTFKDNLTTLGKEIDAKVTYTIDGVETELNGDTLGSVTPHYEGNILKSVMKQVDIISDIDIPLNTEINVQFGMRYDTDEYEYIDYGNYIVFSSQKQEDTNNYKIVAYDKMLYAMKDYEELEITYPITIRDYISAICTKIGLEFANANDTFANYDKEIKQELYANLGYTFRDVLDEIAQVTASTICINKDDELEVRYINQAIAESEQLSGTSFDLESDDAPLTIDEFDGEITQETTTGKNLLKWNVYNIFDVTATNDLENQKISVSTNQRWARLEYTAQNLIDMGLVDGAQYVLSLHFENTNANNLQVRFYNSDSSLSTQTSITTATSGDLSLIINYYTGRYLRIYTNTLDSTAGGTVVLSKLQLEQGSNVTSWEKYTNGPSPNSDYPQDIEITTGRQSIDLVGKNLFPYSNLTNQYTYIMPCNVGDTYTLSFRGSATSNQRVFLRTYNGNNAPTSTMVDNVVTYVTTTPTDYTATITSTINGYLYLATSVAPTAYTLENIQLEKGTTASEFEEYKSKSHEINLGKNLLQLTNGSYSNNGITALVENGKITLNGTCTNSTSFILIPSNLSTLDGTYTISANNTSTVGSSSNSTDIRIYKDSSNSFATFLYTQDSYHTYTINNISGLTFRIRTGVGLTYDNFVIYPQLEKGSTKTSYSPYFTPIELGKIGNYKDRIFKGKGINLFDKDNYVSEKAININDGGVATDSNYMYTDYIPVSNGTYVINSAKVGGTNNYGITYYKGDKTFISGNSWNTLGYTSSGTQNNITFTISDSNVKYVIISLRLGTNPTNIETLQIEKNNTSSTYEPYNAKDKWYLYKAIGKVILNGSENWSINGTDRYKIEIQSLNGDWSIPCYCNNFKNIVDWDTHAITNYSVCIRNGNWGINKARFSFVDRDFTTVAAWKSYLASNNVILYYPLEGHISTPTTTEITSSNYPELYSQLKAIEKARTFDGVTYIDSTTPISIDYIKQLETIDEDYIKNTRADFGEKYGPINSVVLSRSAESDNVYLRDEDSIDENGLCEVKIKDNQIMNDNDRSDFLPDLLEYLKGIEYYINDFESIGITYLDLLDRYKVVIGDKSYYCVMLNDEVGIHDGLNEIIYTEKPKQNVTDYKKASTTDKQERQTYLMVDKQAQRIDALISDEDENFSRIQVEIDNISSQVQSTNVELDSLGEEIEVVRSSITEQTSEAITDWFNTALKPTIEDLENSVDSNDQTLNEIKSYVRRGVITDPQSPYYNQAFVELGDTTNQTTLRILPNRIQFLTNGQETAFISNNQLYINESTILTKEKIGNWVTTQDENGLLNTYWED